MVYNTEIFFVNSYNPWAWVVKRTKLNSKKVLKWDTLLCNMLVLLRCRGEHEICFWSEIIWIREVKLKEMLYQVLARDSVIKIRCHDVPFRGYSFIICRRRKNKADHYSSHLLSCIVNALNKYHVNHSQVITYMSSFKVFLIVVIWGFQWFWWFCIR